MYINIFKVNFLLILEIKVNWFSIKPSQIFISTQGCLYFSPIRIANNGIT
jgi:hypothetical protein